MNIIDLHCDTLDKLVNENYSFKLNNGHISEENLLKGGYMAQCFAIYTPLYIKGEKAVEYLNSQYNIFKEKILKSDKISAVLTVENGEFLNNNIDNINILKSMEVKILGLVHNGENCIGFPCSDNKNEHLLPLKPFGRQVIDELNDTDIYVDVSHLNFGGFMDVANISKKPFIATHSGCQNICNHKRNLTNEQIRIIGNSGGIMSRVAKDSYVL